MRAWRAQHARALGDALSTLIAVANSLFGYQVELVGRDLYVNTHNPLVVLARHAGPGDSFTLMHLLLTTLHRNPRVVLKRALQWDPGLDVLLTRLDCYFLPSKSGAGEDRAAAVARMVKGLSGDDALLLFPEGGNWTPRRHRRSVLRLLRAGKRERARQVSARTHVLPPRPGGTSAALAVRADTDVLVVAHTGLDVLVNPRQMLEALPLDDRPMRIRAWLHPAPTVPRNPASDPGVVGRAVGAARSVDRHPATTRLTPTMSQVAHVTPRGRNWMLIRGPTGLLVFGTACSQVRWQLPPITSRSPCASVRRSDAPPPRGRQQELARAA